MKEMLRDKILIWKCWACGEPHVRDVECKTEWSCRRCFVKERTGDYAGAQELIAVMGKGNVYVWGEQKIKRRKNGKKMY
jgi:hypothetical protein